MWGSSKGELQEKTLSSIGQHLEKGEYGKIQGFGFWRLKEIFRSLMSFYIIFKGFLEGSRDRAPILAKEQPKVGGFTENGELSLVLMLY